MLAGLDDPVWMYFVHSYAPGASPPTWWPRATTAARSWPRSSATTCGPPSSTPRSRARPGCGCCATSWTCATAQRVADGPLSGHRPARWARACGSSRATSTGRRSTATTRSRWRGRSRPRALRGSTSSTSTRRAAPGDNRDAIAAIARRGTQRRCSVAVACATRRPRARCSAGRAARRARHGRRRAPRARRASWRPLPRPRRGRARPPRRRGARARLASKAPARLLDLVAGRGRTTWPRSSSPRSRATARWWAPTSTAWRRSSRRQRCR